MTRPQTRLRVAHASFISPPYIPSLIQGIAPKGWGGKQTSVAQHGVVPGRVGGGTSREKDQSNSVRKHLQRPVENCNL